MHTYCKERSHILIFRSLYIFGKKIACIFRDKDSESQQFKKNGDFMRGRNGRMRVAAAGKNHSNTKNAYGRKYNYVDISNVSR